MHYTWRRATKVNIVTIILTYNAYTFLINSISCIKVNNLVQIN